MIIEFFWSVLRRRHLIIAGTGIWLLLSLPCAQWTSTDRRITIRIDRGIAYLCHQKYYDNYWAMLPIPYPGFSGKITWNWPRLYHRIVGYPGEAWYGLPMYAIILAALTAVLISDTVKRCVRLSRGLCINCGYDVKVSTASRCPECGHDL